ncbi:uncharacterized protein LOC113849903 [Abrus precatorius]|uniref:Uncharacterized protein LOC113849903 n=1 Tax=Abrus precatorius TaxID=3816 RepID=A0A8B8JX58_ABRPR|nr:uncharacterized protein LOC113849903 [Abrus precatorius]
MDTLNISTSTNFPIPTFCHPKLLNRKFPSTHNKPKTPFHRNPFSLYLSSSTARKFQTWAHFGRPTNRRNFLRKKLLHDHQVRPKDDPSSVSGCGVEESGDGVKGVSVVDNLVELEKPKSKHLGESVLWNKLENWVDQYKKDIEYWGVGSGPIFTVYHDSLGGVKRVSVDEEEILRRSRVGRDVIEDFPHVRSKILDAKNMAREMENGNNVIARNSSVARFVVRGELEGGFVKAVQGFVSQPRLLPKLSGVGRKVLYCLVVLWAVKKLFAFGDKEVQYSEMEKEMMRRKVKARKEKEILVKGAVEVIPEPSETPVVDVKKPKLDKEQLRNNILKVKASADKLVIKDSSAKVTTRSMDMDYKVQEIREMARRARKIEGRDHSPINRDMEMEDRVIENSSNEDEVVKKGSEQDNSLSNHPNEVARKSIDSNPILQPTSVDVAENIDNSVLYEVLPADAHNSYASDVIVPGDMEINKEETEFTENKVHLKNRENYKPSDIPISGSSMINESSVKKKPRIIRSVKEARDYLLKKQDKQDLDTESKTELMKENIADLKSSSVIDLNNQKYQNLEVDKIVSRSDTLNGISDSKPVINASEDSNEKDEELSPTKNDYVKDSGIEPGLEDLQKSLSTKLDCEVNANGTETRLSVKPENLLEKNLHEVEPIVEQIRSDTLNESSDSKPATNPSEDSNQKDMEFGLTKDDVFEDTGVESSIGNLQKYDATLDHEVNGIGKETRLSRNPESWLDKTFHEVEPIIEQTRSDTLNESSDSKPATNPSEDSNKKDMEFGLTKDDVFKDTGVESSIGNLQKSDTTLDHEVNGIGKETMLSGKTENWLDKNFHEVEPLIKQIRAGFRNNYMAAKERVDQPLDIPTEMESFGGIEDGGELDWMHDDHLRDIVFRVRENELSGRDPFYLMNAGDKETFFRGLEKKVEKENTKLSHIHEWLHSNIENIDYGADGISIYDPPEKIIPRWKGPPVEKIPESLNEFLDQRKTSSTRNMNLVKKDESGFAKKSADSSLQGKVDSSIERTKKVKNPKTVIEGSDGSVKVGKKSGKEYWQHTKKWSQGFLESYNAETDPEIKSIMKDMGKGLDRWITDKEIEEAADLMNKLPDRNRNFMEKKLNKIKREMELFGQQAVVSKYREYADDEEEDYLWWLDLTHVLCIELYTVENGEDKVGLYSLEMAEDLELEPKPYHVIAFQDAGDCKNLCYIIQAHLEMLGSGHAFVVARPPKDAFREAKANGFGVTVIKKGELQLNIDQPLEEVEEQIAEIGSKMYHDMMMKERSVDVNSLMKGVFGFSDRSIKKRLKRKLKKPKKG